jgi:RNA polymerase sigma-70 factor (ECF subfamily)
VKADYARREVAEEERERLFGAFSEAVRNFDVEALARVLAEDAVMLADGGGKVSAVPRPLHGGALIARTFIGFARLPTSRWRLEPARINGLPGCLVFDDATGRLVQTIALAPSATEPGRIGALYIQRNPDKLQGVLAALGRHPNHPQERERS